MTFSRQFPSTIKTDNTKKPAIADFEVESPFKKDIFCNGVEIISNPEFSRKGVIIIEVNNVILFDSRNTEAFGNVAKFPIPLNAVLERDKFVRIFAFNQVDTNKIKCTVNVYIDEVSKVLDSSLEYFDLTVINTGLSVLDVLFDNVLRQAGFNLLRLIDMEGYKKLILVISSGAYQGPDIIIGGENVVDGDLNTFGTPFSFSTSVVDGVFGSVIFDNADTKTPSGKFRLEGGANVWTVTLQTSNDNVNWTDAASVIAVNNDVITLTGSPANFNFIRIIANIFSGGAQDMQFECAELFDATNFGGTALVSFDIKDAFGNFQTLISSSDIGAISQGETVVKTIGDVINDVSTDKFNFALPSTQSDFGVRLQIQNGGVTVGVSFQRIA